MNCQEACPGLLRRYLALQVRARLAFVGGPGPALGLLRLTLGVKDLLYERLLILSPQLGVQLPILLRVHLVGPVRGFGVVHAREQVHVVLLWRQHRGGGGRASLVLSGVPMWGEINSC